jgi:hypothetical protein
MKLTVDSSHNPPGLVGLTRSEVNAGVWFTDPDGMVTHRMDFHLWALLGRPQEMELDLGVTDSELHEAKKAIVTATPERPMPVVSKRRPVVQMKPVNRKS